jgi:TRAP-type mannitol/chloroaromatic compound transport system substrate-binding protein
VTGFCAARRAPLQIAPDFQPPLHGMALAASGRRAKGSIPMKRREFLRNGLGAVATSAAVASPAIAQTAPTIKWRMTSSFPKALDITYGAAEQFCKCVSDLTEGRFQIQQFAAGEIVPGLQALDAVQNDSVEMAYTGALFYAGKDPTFALGASVPFMMNPRQQHAWFYHASGNELFNDFLAKYNVVGFPCGNTGMQWGGWFRKEIKSAADLQGIKMRIAGLAGRVAVGVGIVPQQTAPGDIYPALERGAIDAVEYIGPYDDEKLGFDKIVKFYYTPGWQEGGTVFHTMINKTKWAELPKSYQRAIEISAQAATTSMLAHYDAKNPEALRRIIANGVKVSVFPPDVIEKMYASAEDLYKGLIASNESFAKIYASQKEFRDRNYFYHQAADFQFDTMMLQIRRKS